MAKIIEDHKKNREKSLVIRFSTTNEMSAQKAMKMIIKAHEEIMEGVCTCTK